MRTSNRTIGIALASIIIGMVGLSFASVPLYRMFCAVTGYGGTPQIGKQEAPGATRQLITVRFNANTYPNLPWQFRPLQEEIRLPLGDEQLAYYTARNEAKNPVTGVALYNVTPDKAGKYFHKTACFCFNQQTLAPDQKAEFPLSFWVDPEIAKDPDTADIHTITLSYTFFRTLEDAAKSGALAQAGPHVGPLTRQTP
ncbi:MAG TPA: cytochrome c oxidase assembly protein [Acetobacteraceae bacterium]|nr:cytochrome c oxidase assembly protein [Acetobacteraceae bacterium]